KDNKVADVIKLAEDWPPVANSFRHSSAREIPLGQHHVDALVAIDDLRHAHIRGEARQGIGLITVETRARANEIKDLSQRNHNAILHSGSESQREWMRLSFAH